MRETFGSVVIVSLWLFFVEKLNWSGEATIFSGQGGDDYRRFIYNDCLVVLKFNYISDCKGGKL